MNPISDSGADDQCFKIISLSDDHLPACLKPCFLYFGIVKEDAFIDAPQLLRFWIAEGFVKGKKGVCLEELAEDYLYDLSDRNLIIVGERSWNGKVEHFVIHDIVRELCLKLAQQEKFLGVLGNTNVTSERRIVVPRELSTLQTHAVGALELPSLLRSLMCHSHQVCFKDELWVNLRLLRLWGCVNQDFLMKNGKVFPTLSFQQVNLRYLSFNADSGGLPYTCPILSSMSIFWNMQTLIINNEISMPFEIWEVTQLRHLEFVPSHGVINEQSDQQKRNVLENLHTLLGVRNLRLTEEVCRRMPNIKNLSVFYYRKSGDGKTSSSDYCPQNLSSLSKLVSLDCYFGRAYKWRDVVLNFVLPTSLQELSLRNCHWEDLTKIIKSLPHLGSLELSCIRGPQWDLAEEDFPRLKALKISECNDLIKWNGNSSQFLVLEILSISEALQLSEIPFDIGEIPTLHIIELSECSVSAAVSAMRIVVEQESLGNDNLLLKVHFWEMDFVERFQTMVQEECLTTNSLRLSYPFSDVLSYPFGDNNTF